MTSKENPPQDAPNPAEISDGLEVLKNEHPGSLSYIQEKLARGEKFPTKEAVEEPAVEVDEEESRKVVRARLNKLTLDKKVQDFVNRMDRGNLMSSPADQTFLKNKYKEIGDRYTEVLLNRERALHEKFAREQEEKRARRKRELEEKIGQLSEDELRESLEKANLDPKGEKKELIEKLINAGYTEIENEPIEDWVYRKFQQEFQSREKGIEEKMTEKIGPQVDEKIRDLRKKLEGHFVAQNRLREEGKAKGIILDRAEGRKHFEHQMTFRRKVDPSQYEKIYNEAEQEIKTKKQLPAGRRRVGFFGRGISENSAVHVEVDGDLPDGLTATYETKNNPGQSETVILTGEKTEFEKNRKSIFDTKIAGEELSKDQIQAIRSPEVQAAVDRKISLFRKLERERKDRVMGDMRQAAKNLINGEELTDRQRRIYDNSPRIKALIDEMVREGKFFDTPKDIYDMQNFPEIFDQIEEGYKKAGYVLPPIEELRAQIPNYENLKKEEKIKAIARKKEGLYKENQFEGDDLVGATGYLESKEGLRKNMPEHVKSILDRKDNSPEEKALVGGKTRVEEIFRKLNLNKEKMKSIAPDFFFFNDIQQIYLLEKLEKKIERDASLIAEDIALEELDKRPESFGERIRLYFKKNRKEKLIAKEKKKFLAETKENELEEFKEDISDLTQYVKNLKHPLKMNEDGKIYFEYEKEDSNVSEPEFLKNFNLAASRLAEMPLEWNSNTATKKQRKEYAEALEKYEIRKRILYDTKRGKYDYNKTDIEEKERRAFEWVSSVDLDINATRIMTQNPEILKVRDDNFWVVKKINNMIGSRPGVQASVSFISDIATRLLHRGSGPLLGSTVISLALGAYLGIRNQKSEYRNLERRKRFGYKVDDEGVAEYLDLTKGKTLHKLEHLIKVIKEEGNEARRNKLMETLRIRLSGIDQAVREGHVNFGDKYKEILQISSIMRDGGMLLLKSDPAEKEFLNKVRKIAEESYAERKKHLGKVGWERKTRYGRAAVLGGLSVASASFFSWMATDYIKEIGSAQDYFPDRIREIFTEWGEGSWNDVKEGLLKSR